MEIKISYGQGDEILEIPRDNIAGIIRPKQLDTGSGGSEKALKAALNCRGATEFVRSVAGKRLCVLLDDGTRDEPYEDIFKVLFGFFTGASSVDFIICTGTHNSDTPGNARISELARQVCEKFKISDFSINIHDCRSSKLVLGPVTKLGTRVEYNALADEANIFLVVSDAKVHYFSGYSNPVKNFVPGICSFDTVEKNHSLALDEKSTFGLHPWHNDPGRRDNPVAVDQLEGAEFIVRDRLVYSLITVTASAMVQWAVFDLAKNACAQAFDWIDQANTHTVEPVDRLIVSPGHFPNDCSLYNAQRALELTKNAINDDGEILFVSQCSQGVGEDHTLENFYHRLTLPTDEILDSIEQNYKLFSHKPYKFAQLIKRTHKIFVYTSLDDDTVRSAHMHPVDNPQLVIDRWLDEKPDCSIMVIDGANKIALYRK